MTNPKTTITGLITALVALASHFNLVIPDTWQGFLIAAGVLILGFFAKDAKSS